MPIPTPCRVLVVDDNPDAAESLATVIRILGHEAQSLTSPHFVEPAIEHFKPHVLLLDISMPDMDGWTLAERLRQRYPRDRLKLVAVTGHATPSDHARSRSAGFDAHVAKPVGFEILQHILEQCFTDSIRLPPKKN